MTNFNADKFRDYVVCRRRYIPDETLYLNKDNIYHVSENLIVTGWRAIRKRLDISAGISAYYPKACIKVSKFFGPDSKLLYWYNDICEIKIEGTLIKCTDLLIDIIIHPDERMQILDIDEFAEAIKKSYITKEQEFKALKSFDYLTKLIYNGDYRILQKPIFELEESGLFML